MTLEIGVSGSALPTGIAVCWKASRVLVHVL